MQRPNAVEWLPIYRVLSSPLLLFLALRKKRAPYKWLVSLSLLTDLIDGVIARSFALERKQGAKLDSVGDMLTLITAVAGIVTMETQFVKEHKTPILIAVSLYLLQLIASLIRYGTPSSFHTYMAKATMLIHGTFLIHAFFDKPNEFLFWLTISAAVIECMEETALVMLADRPDEHIKSILSAAR
jgi:phosphatidylglycerophosphate synthase